MTQINVYQINLERDVNGCIYRNYDWVIGAGKGEFDPSIYDKIYSGVINGENDLEDIFWELNKGGCVGNAGRSISVSDIIEVVKSDKIDSGFYYCNTMGFEQIDFNNEKSQIKGTVQAVYVQPGKYPEKISFSPNLYSLQKKVDGPIEVFYPFSEDTCIICNEEGKIRNMEPNRAVYDDNGEIMDIIFGPFIVIGAGEERFESLTDEQIEKYAALYHYPEKRIDVNGRTRMVKYLAEERDRDDSQGSGR